VTNNVCDDSWLQEKIVDRIRKANERLLNQAIIKEKENCMTATKNPNRWELLKGLAATKSLLTGICVAGSITLASATLPAWAEAAAPAVQNKPNILVIWGDDIGQFNISANNNGMMGYKTPNIDRIAKEGALFTDWYGQQSCTAGRAAFITGQSPIRTGLTKVGLPGAPEGITAADPTIATLLKAQGYMTGQFGKNHLGDLDSMLPTAHGFDEFFGNLYHLNAEEEPENPDYPKDPAFKKKFGPRGVIHSFAGGTITDTASTDTIAPLAGSTRSNQRQSVRSPNSCGTRWGDSSSGASQVPSIADAARSG
jgi:arylsulfatase